MPVELAPSKRVKARKEHRCDYCGKRIYVDEEHTVSKLVEGGSAYTWRECDRCAHYVRKMMAYWNYPIGEGYNCEDMAYDMTENHPDVWDAWKESDGK